MATASKAKVGKKRKVAAASLMPVNPRRKTGDHPDRVSPSMRSIRVSNTDARRLRIRTITARTARARAELDAKAKGADMSDLDHLPVMIKMPRGPRRPTKKKKKTADVDATETPALYARAWR
jgi:hypothetical protein